MDLAHGALFYPPATVRTAPIEEMLDADVVVISADGGARPGKSRLELLHKNASVIRDIGTQLRGARGIIVMVSNPVDILTRIMTEASGLPAARVIGTGTMLDTARLRHAVSRVIEVDRHSDRRARHRRAWRLRGRALVGSARRRCLVEAVGGMGREARGVTGGGRTARWIRDYPPQGRHQPRDWHGHGRPVAMRPARRAARPDNLPRAGRRVGLSRRGYVPAHRGGRSGRVARD